MADWGQTVVQILATPIASAAASFAVASAVVRRQSTGTKQVEALDTVRLITGQLVLEADTLIHVQRWTQYESLNELYLQGFDECAKLLDASRRLSPFSRAKIHRYCVQIYGRHTVRVAKTYPRGAFEPDESPINLAEHTWIFGSGESDSIAGPHGHISILAAIFGNDTELFFPKEADRKPQIDLQGRGLVNAFRLAGTDLGKIWSINQLDVQMPLAKRISNYSRSLHDLKLSAIWL